MYCQCGSQVFFDSEQCVHCGSLLGFDVDSMEMRSVRSLGGALCETPDGQRLRFCDNALRFDVCNWLLPADSDHSRCFGCQFNRTVPNQSLPDNQRRWRVLEEAKKRLLYTLIRLGLPLVDGWRDPKNGLLFDFIEDGRSRLEFAETFVSIGYLGGVITINTLEADTVARVEAREKLNEGYRTVLGHLRHESGHYYWARLKPDLVLRRDFADLFGDESADYGAALQGYYERGPRPDWREHHISAYASAHPAEDWAESWGHYLHIYDALETAAAHGVIASAPAELDIRGRIDAWQDLSLVLNELNRSVGRGDAYPFVINSRVEEKLVFVDRAVCALRQA
nr:putative zinc-binding metallopeptidase [Parahaliea mediterranea]